MKKTVFKNALLVTPESVTEGDLACSDGVITGVGGSCGAEGSDVVDCEGAWLIPGLVELHTDNLERYMIPRPKVVWPEALPAFFAHDAQKRVPQGGSLPSPALRAGRPAPRLSFP